MKTFIYKCVDCRTKNTTQSPPEDNMLHCQKCGYPTVHSFVGVKIK